MLCTGPGPPATPAEDSPAERDNFVFRRHRLRIAGRVQGVGFRPFVHRLAHEHGLSGFVRNDGEGVTLEAQGTPADLEHFAAGLRARKPPAAIIETLAIVELPLRPDEEAFTIEASDHRTPGQVTIAPDLAACAACLRDVRSVNDRRRYHYALTNCTACGPRFSIIRAVPYDRANTTMAGFAMCDACRAEYANATDRRFHAQPTACHACGPKVRLVEPGGQNLHGDAIALAVQRLLAGQIVAVQGLGGFHLAVRADSAAAVECLRQLKHRPAKPFALMVASVEAAREIVALSDRGVEMLKSPAAPIVLAQRRADARIAGAVAPSNHRLGVMLAYTPLHHLLFDALDGRCGALVMTSANDSDEPLIFTHEDATERLGAMCSAILWHDRPIERAVDDSVVLDANGHSIMLRRSRGYVPDPLRLPIASPSPGLCVGGELKNAIAIVRGQEVTLSQHLGDLGNARTYAAFKRAVDDMLRLLSVEPRWVAHDLHPTYVSTMFAAHLAATLRIPRLKFQHHHAHAAAVLAENGQTGPALAVVCDGTGYGTDGTTWGGELLAVDLRGFRRLGHLRPLRLPGGDASARQPWRCAMALLLNAFGATYRQLPIIAQVAPDAEQADFVGRMLHGGVNCITSTAAGRVFGGVAALLGLASENRFEAEAPLALESTAASHGHAPRAMQPLFALRDNGTIVIDHAPLVREIVRQRERGTPAGELAVLFHDQFAAAWEAAVLRAVEQTGLICVALSGGVFCNAILDRLLTDRLRRRGLHVLRHRHVPPNDGGLALGQAALAAYQVAQRPQPVAAAALAGRK